MRIVMKKHTGVVVHWGKNDSLGDVCNALGPCCTRRSWSRSG